MNNEDFNIYIIKAVTKIEKEHNMDYEYILSYFNIYCKNNLYNKKNNLYKKKICEAIIRKDEIVTECSSSCNNGYMNNEDFNIYIIKAVAKIVKEHNMDFENILSYFNIHCKNNLYDRKRCAAVIRKDEIIKQCSSSCKNGLFCELHNERFRNNKLNNGYMINEYKYYHMCSVSIVKQSSNVDKQIDTGNKTNEENVLDKAYLEYVKYNDNEYLVDACTREVYDFNDNTLLVGNFDKHDKLHLINTQ